jgi:hypothetical protein
MRGVVVDWVSLLSCCGVLLLLMGVHCWAAEAFVFWRGQETRGCGTCGLSSLVSAVRNHLLLHQGSAALRH